VTLITQGYGPGATVGLALLQGYLPGAVVAADVYVMPPGTWAELNLAGGTWQEFTTVAGPWGEFVIPTGTFLDAN
jgi:hypothetical protein